MGDVAKLAGKRPTTLLDHANAMVLAFQEQTRLSQQDYAALAVAVDFSPTYDSNVDARNKMSTTLTQVEKDYLGFKQGVVADVKKLLS